jgi:hypothetical protein
MFWLENGKQLFYIFSIPQFRPTQLTITIRYTDWWFWEVDDTLHMEEGWLRYFKGNPGLRVLTVEYETLSRKKAEMMPIIRRNKQWKWKGPNKLGGTHWYHRGPGNEIEYIVVTDTWRFVGGELSEKEMEGRLTSMKRAPERDEVPDQDAGI